MKEKLAAYRRIIHRGGYVCVGATIAAVASSFITGRPYSEYWWTLMGVAWTGLGVELVYALKYWRLNVKMKNTSSKDQE